jgi:transcriptional regulator with XRE-family HTH domain
MTRLTEDLPRLDTVRGVQACLSPEDTMPKPPPNPIERQKFAEALQKAIAEVGISQRELARRLEVSQASVSQWLHGQTTPRPGLAAQLERELGQEPGSLLIPLGYVVVDPKGRPLGVPEAIANDPLLGPREREVLQDVYRALVKQRGRDPRQLDLDDRRLSEPRQIEPDDHDLGLEIDL